MTFPEQLNEWLHNWRYPLLVIFIILVVGGSGLVIYSEIDSRREQRALEAVEVLQEEYEEYDGEDSAEQERLLGMIEEIVERYPRTYAMSRALFIRAALHWEVEEWEESAVDYLAIVERFPTSYLASVSLFNAATAWEEANDWEQAVEALTRLVEEFAITDTVERARALLSLGRLYEEKEEYRTAADYYNRLLDLHEESSWANLARNRLTSLTVDGKL